MDRKLINHFILQINAIQHGHLWMGENFEQKLNSIPGELAFKKPLGSLHSVAELLAHLTAWNEDLAWKITQGKGKLLDRDPENWTNNEVLRIAGWNQVRKKYYESVLQITDLLNEKGDAFLTEEYVDQDFKGKYPYAFAVNGMLQHQIYHLGQIGLVIRMVR